VDEARVPLAGAGASVSQAEPIALPAVPVPETESGTASASHAPGDPAGSDSSATGHAVADEITLAFGTGIDGDGQRRPLPDSLVLAAILCAVEAEREQPAFLWSRPAEVVEAIAPVYWPLLVVPVPEAGRVVIFDGTGVWSQTFQHSRMPPVQDYRSRLATPPASSDLAAWFRELRAPLLFQGVPDSMKVGGLLPVNLPLLADIIAQTGFRSDPSTPHTAFLPTRHPIEWYETAVGQIGRSVRGFDAEIAELAALRDTVQNISREISARLDGERRQLQLDLTSRSRLYATEEMDRDVDSLHNAIREQIHVELGRIRAADIAIAHARASARVAEILVRRGSSPREDTSELRSRMRSEAEVERRFTQEIREARGRIASLHERERDSYGVLTDRVALVENRAADELSTHELLRDDVATAGKELIAAFDSQIARRRVERDQLAGHLLAIPALEGVQTVWLPLWVATLTGPGGTRCVVFPPMRVRSGLGVSDSIRTLFGGVVLPLEPRTAQFGQTLRTTLEETIRTDPWLFGVTRQLVRAADTTADPAFLQRLAFGLQEIRQAGWITADQERRYFAASSQHLRARPMGAPRTESPVPSTGSNVRPLPLKG
jgi:hypothetical protein